MSSIPPRDVRLTGIVNLLTAFPQLATGLLIARYATRPSEEFKLREFPQQLLNILAIAIRTMSLDVFENIMAKLAGHDAFLDSYSNYVAQRLKGSSFWHRSLLVTFAEHLRDGMKLATSILCLRLEHVLELARGVGLSVDVLRIADAGFLYQYRYEDSDEPLEEDIEDYLCGGEWLPLCSKKLAQQLSEDLKPDNELFEKVKAMATTSPECYAIARATAFHGIHGLKTATTILGISPEECFTNPIRSQDHVHVGVLMLLQKSLVRLEEHLYGGPPKDYNFDPKLGVYINNAKKHAIAYGTSGIVTLTVLGDNLPFSKVTVITSSYDKPIVLNQVIKRIKNLEVEVKHYGD